MQLGWDQSSDARACGLGEQKEHFIRVRWIDLDRDGSRLVDWGSDVDLFLKDEVDRARRMNSERGRRDFLAGRAALRQLLGRELGEPAYSESFLSTTSGKPHLRGGNLHFSLSRTKGIAAIAISSRPVGIDVERNDCVSADLSKKIRLATDGLDLRFENCQDVRKDAPSNEMELWTLLEAYSKLKDTRLAEHFSDWGSSGGGTAFSPNRSDLPAIAHPVNLPRGYRCFCCSEQSDARLDVSEFCMDAL